MCDNPRCYFNCTVGLYILSDACIKYDSDNVMFSIMLIHFDCIVLKITMDCSKKNTTSVRKGRDRLVLIDRTRSS